MILYIERPKETKINKKTTLEQNKYSMAAGYKSHIKKKNQLYFYIPVMNNSKQKLRKQLHFQRYQKTIGGRKVPEGRDIYIYTYC